MTKPEKDVLLVAGVDVGSSAVKVVILEDREGEEPIIRIGRRERVRRRDTAEVAARLYDACLKEAGLEREQLDYVATTGEGETVSFRTGHFYGMTTHARGGLFLEPEARAVIDIGALHARAVLMDDRAKVLSYRMTSQCASGSGQFLENIARYLGITIDEIGPLSLEADDPEACSSICAVLAETDVINMVSRGISTSNIIKGIHQSMAGRYLRLINAVRASGVVLVTGGLAADVGLLAAIREAAESNRKRTEPVIIRAHEQSALAGAYGAALWGGFRQRVLARKGVSLTNGDSEGAVAASGTASGTRTGA
jgi:benzoyl-CoA reductase subunit D